MSKAPPKGDAPPVEFEEGKITVVVRCRPFNEREHALRSIPCLDFQQDGQTLQIYERGVPGPTNPDSDKGRNHTFSFDKAYHMHIAQDVVYHDVGKPVLAASLKGFNTCIFAYGQTGSGKSFAMMGPAGGRDASKAPGIIPRLCTDLFEEVQQRSAANEAAIAEATRDGAEEYMLPPTLTIHVDVSYLEIYQEKVKCLLDPKKDNLKVRQHPALGVYVDQLTEVSVQSFDKVMDLIEGGNNSRHIAATNMNDRSSRSHAIFAITLTQKRCSKTKDGQDSATEIKARINLVDLAGSERAKSTGAEGDTLREGAQINRSLTVLGLVISGLAEQSKATAGKAPFIPYRDSMLTYLLKESLGGNSKTYMLSTLSPAHVNYEETLSTLRYADRAKAIVTKACINESAGDKKIRELEDEVSQLREKIREYQQRVEKQSEVAKVVPKLNLSGVAGGAAVRGRAALSATGGGRGGGAGRSFALVTPRSAINRVVTREERAADGDNYDNDEEDGSWMPEATPRQPGDVARLEARLHAAESLMEKLTETDEQKEAEADHIIGEIRQHKTVKATRADPHLVNLDPEFVSDFVMEYLVDEVTYLGTAQLDEEVLNSRCIVLTGANVEGIGAQHCCFVRMSDGRVILRPQPGCDTFIGAEDAPISDDVTLANGTLISIGESMLQFKFVDPATQLTRRRNTVVSTSRSRASPSIPQQPSADAPPMGVASKPSTPVDSACSTPPLTPPAPEIRAPPPMVPRLNLGLKLPIKPTSTEDDNRHTDPNEGVEERSPSPPPAVPPLSLPPRPAASGNGSTTARNSIVNIGTTRAAGSLTARGVARPSTASASPPTVMAFNEEVQACFRHSFVLLGRCGSGKSAFRASLAMKDKWYSFFKKEAVTVLPTFGVEISKLECGTLQKVELTMIELCGRDTFSMLQSLLPERRVTYVLCFKLGADVDQPSLATFRNYLEFILCQSASSETSVMLLGSHRDNVGTSSADDRKITELLNDLESQVRGFFEMLQPLPERRPRVAAKFAVDNMNRTVLSGSSKMSKFSELLTFLGDHAVHRCRSDPDFPNCLIPTRLLNLARKLLEIRAQGRWCLPSTEYKSIAKQIDQRYERSLEELHRHTHLLHCWGILNHQYRHLLLKKTIVLDITWVMNIIAAICCCVPGGASPHGSTTEMVLSERLPLILSKEFDCYRDRVPFQIKDLRKVDPFGLCGRGVLTMAAATEMLRLPLREKGYTIRNVDALLELLENYDVLMKGTKLKFSISHSTNSGVARSSGLTQSTSNLSFGSEEPANGASNVDEHE